MREKKYLRSVGLCVWFVWSVTAFDRRCWISRDAQHQPDWEDWDLGLVCALAQIQHPLGFLFIYYILSQIKHLERNPVEINPNLSPIKIEKHSKIAWNVYVFF